MTSLLCAHCLPANRAFQNRKSGWSNAFVLSDWALIGNERSTTNEKIRTVLVFKNNCKLL
jgi:hypothetical protein